MAVEKSLPNMVRDITFYYVKFYYDKYLKVNDIDKMEPSQISMFITEHYTNKENDIKKYIRNSLKKNLGDNYNPITTENILLEMFNDPELAIARIKNEIIDYQEQHKY
jgi:hypothetical protein